jgi:hypothetical protein
MWGVPGGLYCTARVASWECINFFQTVGIICTHSLFNYFSFGSLCFVVCGVVVEQWLVSRNEAGVKATLHGCLSTT